VVVASVASSSKQLSVQLLDASAESGQFLPFFFLMQLSPFLFQHNASWGHNFFV
jgi:hypothetical protein